MGGTIFGPFNEPKKKPKKGFMRRVGATGLGVVGGAVGGYFGGPGGAAAGSSIGSMMGEELFDAPADRGVASSVGGYGSGPSAQPQKEEYRPGRPSHPAARRSPRPAPRPRRVQRRRSAAPELWYKPRPRQYYPKPPRTHPRRSRGQTASPIGPRYGYPDTDYSP